VLSAALHLGIDRHGIWVFYGHNRVFYGQRRGTSVVTAKSCTLELERYRLHAVNSTTSKQNNASPTSPNHVTLPLIRVVIMVLDT
jgi:hypothetical protein